MARISPVEMALMGLTALVRRPSRVSAAAAMFVISIVVAACAGESPSKRDVTGAWKGPSEAQLVFLADGTLSVSHLPTRFLTGRRDPGDITTRGTWRLVSPPGVPSLVSVNHWDSWDIELDLPSAKTQAKYTVGETGDPYIYLGAGDPGGGDRIDFTRVR